MLCPAVIVAAGQHERQLRERGERPYPAITIAQSDWLLMNTAAQSQHEASRRKTERKHKEHEEHQV
jgi:hypothetical protein